MFVRVQSEGRSNVPIISAFFGIIIRIYIQESTMHHPWILRGCSRLYRDLQPATRRFRANPQRVHGRSQSTQSPVSGPDRQAAMRAVRALPADLRRSTRCQVNSSGIQVYETIDKILILLCAGFALGPISHVNSLPAGDCLYDCEGPLCYDFSNKTDMCMAWNSGLSASTPARTKGPTAPSLIAPRIKAPAGRMAGMTKVKPRRSLSISVPNMARHVS